MLEANGNMVKELLKIKLPFTWIKNNQKGRAFASSAHGSAEFQGLSILFGKNLK